MFFYNKEIWNKTTQKRKLAIEGESERDDLLQENISIPNKKNVDQNINNPLTAESLESEDIILEKDQEF